MPISGENDSLRNRLEKRHFRALRDRAGRTGQLRHRGRRFALKFGLGLAFADRLVLVRRRIKIQNGNPG
jgi:hypothetical protein